MAVTVTATETETMDAPVSSHLVRRSGRALGSPLRLTVDGVEGALVDAAWEAVLDAFAVADGAMSRFRADSELTGLHAAGGRGRPVSRELRIALAAAHRAMRVTDGRFDPTVLRALEQLGASGVPQAFPREIVRSGGFLHRRGREVVELRAPVDLGGIGKGLALRWAANRLRAALPTAGFLLEAGGDIVSGWRHRDGPWAVAIEDPTPDADPVAVIELVGERAAVATSSVRIGRWHDPTGRPVHHLIDPRTGGPGGDGLGSVTVAHPDPAWSEVWSKALFLEGSIGIAAVARRRGLAAWWVTLDGRIEMTPAARQRTTWVRDEQRRVVVG